MARCYEWRLRKMVDGNGDSDYNPATGAALKDFKVDFDNEKAAIAAWEAAGKPLDRSHPFNVDGEHDVEIVLYCRCMTRDGDVTEWFEAKIRDGVLDENFDYGGGKVEERFHKQVAKVFKK
jgi:hypothetical protein